MDPDTPLERVKYFEGQLLSVADLKAEQEYFLERQRRHNRYLHGWGVRSGLKVALASPTEIIVEPGVAIDCAGNEIHVPAPVRLAIPTDRDGTFVRLRYQEIETAPVAQPCDAASTTPTEPTFTRIREGFLIDIVDVDPTCDQREQGMGTPGCGSPHPLCIARLTRGRHGWKSG